ncbi:MAG: PSD1 and planctomycete cytochrome C domain-containing protein, partial [Pontiella sp.]|nr:PSD1 and planctomycete cytochrome C domain-containing protein [Pontiella sp.]
MKASNTLKAGIFTVALSGAAVFSACATVDFETELLPILEEKCFRCHSERITEPKAGILLDHPEAIMKGNEYGPIVVKMLPEESVLYERITLPSGKRGIMPPAGKGDPCTPEQIELVRQWIKEGAKFGNWTGNDKPKATKPPKKQNNNSRLSLSNYGTEKGIQIDLTPDPKYPMRFSPKMVQVKARAIDALVEDFRKEIGVQALPLANDRVFVRRAYLGIAGRTPTNDEAVAFLSSKDSKKRAKLIDQLVDSEGYVNHWFNFWADLLKVESVRFVPSVYYAEWIKDALRNNMPYDRLSYELITATGMAYQNGATGWAASDANMAPDHMANTMQAFLGMQLQCAQCHDHPYDQWNQYEFQSLVSYFGGVRWNGVNNKHFVRKIEKAGIEISVKQEKYFGNRMAYNYRYAIWEPSFTRWNRLPKDYQYADAKPRQMVPPQVMFGEQPQIEDSPREAFGKWVTAEENQWFTKAIVNRLWKQTMGVG